MLINENSEIKFFVYHPINLGLVYFLTHNTKNRNVDLKNQIIKCEYKNFKLVFDFRKNFINELDAYHVIFRQDAVRKSFFLPQLAKFQEDNKFPDCLKYEYEYLVKKLDYRYSWIFFYNYGENSFVHLTWQDILKGDELKFLKKLSELGIFFTDNYIEEKNALRLNNKNFHNCITNDLFMWNYLAKISWAKEFSNTYKYLSPPYKLSISFRSPKPHRIEIAQKISNLNNDEIFLSYSNSLFNKFAGTDIHSWEGTYDDFYSKLKSIDNLNINVVDDESENDFSNLKIIGNTADNDMELDYYFRILPKGQLQLLDETHSYSENKLTPMNLSEKTYILLLANIPFISTHHYPLDLIQKMIYNEPYPYYDEIYECTNDVDKLISFIDKLLKNWDEMYPKIKEWTFKVHQNLTDKINSENSFLEKIIND